MSGQAHGMTGLPRLRRLLLPVIGAFVFALGFGLNYGIENQNTYLLAGLRLAKPDLLAHDWLATQTTAYHSLFAYPAAALFYLDDSGWLFAAVQVFMLALGAAIILHLVRSVTERQTMLVFVLVLALALVTQTRSVAGTLLYNPVFQPATLGVTGFLAAVCLFVKRRHFLSGLALAAGGIFHANYLLLAIPVFLIAHLLVDRRPSLVALVQQFALPLLAIAALLPAIGPIALGGGTEGIGILLSIRSPMHYRPLTFGPQFAPLVGWLLLAAASVYRVELSKLRLSAPLAVLVAMTIVVAAGTLLTTAAYVTPVAQAYVWRLCPIATLFCQFYAVRWVASTCFDGPSPSNHRAYALSKRWQVALVTIAAGCFVYYYGFENRDGLVLVVLAGLLLLGSFNWWRTAMESRRFGRNGVPTERGSPVRVGTPVRTILLASLCLLLLAGRGFSENSSLLQPETPETQLHGWARTTAQDATFLIPPEMDNFRLSSQRAVVVDWKSTPFVPAEVVEWYRRIDSESGHLRPQNRREAAEGYAGLSADQLIDLADHYQVSFVVLKNSAKLLPPSRWVVVYENQRYKVLDTGRGNDGEFRIGSLAAGSAFGRSAQVWTAWRRIQTEASIPLEREWTECG